MALSKETGVGGTKVVKSTLSKEDYRPTRLTRQTFRVAPVTLQQKTSKTSPKMFVNRAKPIFLLSLLHGVSSTCGLSRPAAETTRKSPVALPSV